jgi:hypothetical protein
MQVRPEIKALAEMMERKLQLNEHKGTKGLNDLGYLINRAKEELAEVEIAFGNDSSAVEILAECADVANFALFLAQLACKQSGDRIEHLGALAFTLDARRRDLELEPADETE